MTTQAFETREIVARLHWLQSRIADLTSEADGLKAELRAYPPGDYDSGEGAAFRVIARRRFDSAAAMRLVPAAEREACFYNAVDEAEVRRHLTAAQLDACMIASGRNSVTLL